MLWEKSVLNFLVIISRSWQTVWRSTKQWIRNRYHRRFGGGQKNLKVTTMCDWAQIRLKYVTCRRVKQTCHTHKLKWRHISENSQPAGRRGGVKANKMPSVLRSCVSWKYCSHCWSSGERCEEPMTSISQNGLIIVFCATRSPGRPRRRPSSSAYADRSASIIIDIWVLSIGCSSASGYPLRWAHRANGNRKWGIYYGSDLTTNASVDNVSPSPEVCVM